MDENFYLQLHLYAAVNQSVKGRAHGQRLEFPIHIYRKLIFFEHLAVVVYHQKLASSITRAEKEFRIREEARRVRKEQNLIHLRRALDRRLEKFQRDYERKAAALLRRASSGVRSAVVLAGRAHQRAAFTRVTFGASPTHEASARSLCVVN